MKSSEVVKEGLDLFLRAKVQEVSISDEFIPLPSPLCNLKFQD